MRTRPLSPSPVLDHPTARPRVLFVAEAVSLAHVGRPALLARWASAAGYDVHFACGPTYTDLVRGEGLSPVPLATIAPRTFYDRLARGEFFYTAAELTEYVRAELDLLRGTRPDLVVGDFRLSMSISAALLGVPLVTLSNAYWSPAAASRFPPPRAGWFRLLPRPVRKLAFACVRPLAFRCFGRPLNQLRCRLGLPEMRDFRHHYAAGDWCAYLDLPGWVPLPELPPGHFFLGPLVWQPRGLLSLPLGKLGQRRPLVYVSMGSSGAGGVLPNVLRSLLELNCDVALSGVSEQPALAPGRALPNTAGRLRAAPLFDPTEGLRRAALTVCHGGSGTIYQSLAAGVPVLSLPGNPDQALAAAAAVAHGAGLLLEPEQATHARLNAAVSSLLTDERYAAGAARVADALRRHETRQQWQDFLASVLGRVLPAEPAAPRTAPAPAGVAPIATRAILSS